MTSKSYILLVCGYSSRQKNQCGHRSILFTTKSTTYWSTCQHNLYTEYIQLLSKLFPQISHTHNVINDTFGFRI